MSEIKTIIYEFNENQIEFLFNNDENVMVNATQMANTFGKRVDHFLKSESIKEFIFELEIALKLKKHEAEFTPNGGNSIKKINQSILQTKGHMGTYMHRLLAIKFAAWLNPKFDVWIIMTIDILLFGIFAEQKERMKKKAKALNEIETIEEKLSENEDFKKYLELKDDIQDNTNKTRSENTNQMKLFRDKYK